MCEYVCVYAHVSVCVWQCFAGMHVVMCAHVFVYMCICVYV